MFDSLKNRFQNDLELMKGSKFVFDYDHLLYYKFQEKILQRITRNKPFINKYN